ncbi:MAG: RDD family protein [Burkholderiales bacterium]
MLTATPGLFRRLACMIYDALLLIAVLFIAVFTFSTLLSFKGKGPLLPLFQIYVVIVIAAYFFYFWRKSGQTLAMKTWRIKLVSANGSRIGYKQSALRLLAASIGIFLGGIGLWWALFDPDKQFLHDRFAGTRLILLEKN